MGSPPGGPIATAKHSVAGVERLLQAAPRHHRDNTCRADGSSRSAEQRQHAALAAVNHARRMCIRSRLPELAHRMNKPFLRPRRTASDALYVPMAWEEDASKQGLLRRRGLHDSTGTSLQRASTAGFERAVTRGIASLVRLPSKCLRPRADARTCLAGRVEARRAGTAGRHGPSRLRRLFDHTDLPAAAGARGRPGRQQNAQRSLAASLAAVRGPRHPVPRLPSRSPEQRPRRSSQSVPSPRRWPPQP
jgi:hypothetical protein